MFIEELLKSLHVHIIHAKNGKEALDICNTNNDIGLVLMDIKLPVLNGHAAATMIKETHPELLIIAQSAYALEHERERYSGIAFDDYITKPINAKEFIKKVTKYLNLDE